MAGEISDMEEFAKRIAEAIENRIGDRSSDSLPKEIEKLTEEFKKKSKSDAELAKQAITETAKSTKKGIEELVSGLTRGGGSFSTITTAANAASDGLKTVGSIGLTVLPGKFKALGAAALVAGTALEKITPVAGAILDIFEQMYSEYEKLSKTGIVTTFTDFQQVMQATNMNIADTSLVLGKFGSQLAQIGGSAIEGRKQFMDLAESAKGTNELMQQLGFSSAEYNSSLIDFLDRESRAGRLLTMDQKQLTLASQQYILEIEKLSKLTGQSREAIQEERKARLGSARYRAVLELSQYRENIDAFLTQVKGTAGAGIADKLTELMAGEVPIGPMKNLVILFDRAGVDLIGTLKKIKTGQISASEGYQILANSIPTLRQNMSGLAGTVGTGIDILEDFAGVLELGRSTGQDRVAAEKKITEELEKGLKGEDKTNTELGRIRRNLYNAQVNIQNAATSLTSVTKAAGMVSEALKDMTSKVREFVGPDKSYERDDRLKKAVESGKMTPEAANEALRHQQRYGPITPGSGASSFGPGQEASSMYGITNKQLMEQGLKVKPNGASHADGAILSPNLISLAKQIQTEIPDFGYITGLNDPHTRTSRSPDHMAGRAMDFTLNTANVTKEKGMEITSKIMSMGAGITALDEYNNPSTHATGKHFHVTIPQFKDGGVVNEDTLARIGEAGPEAVVPLKSGNIPVELNSRSLSDMSSKLDMLISATQRQTSLLSNVFDRLA